MEPRLNDWVFLSWLVINDNRPILILNSANHSIKFTVFVFLFDLFCFILYSSVFDVFLFYISFLLFSHFFHGSKKKKFWMTYIIYTILDSISEVLIFLFLFSFFKYASIILIQVFFVVFSYWTEACCVVQSCSDHNTAVGL